jgi:two-component system, chemotaxis family, chemotaxis protein CheY
MQTNNSQVEAVLRSSRVLIVDDEFNMRKVIRALLLSIGVTKIHDASDGQKGLDAIRVLDPHVVILDWQMAGMNGGEFVRQVRSPGTFPLPNVPIIMLTGHGEASRVVEAMRLGVHEFLLKPVSGKALRDRLVSVLLAPRPMVRRGDYYGPEPRNGTPLQIDDSYSQWVPQFPPEEARSPAKAAVAPKLPKVDRPPAHVIFLP